MRQPLARLPEREGEKGLRGGTNHQRLPHHPATGALDGNRGKEIRLRHGHHIQRHFLGVRENRRPCHQRDGGNQGNKFKLTDTNYGTRRCFQEVGGTLQRIRLRVPIVRNI